jgi:hypothetical protein
VIITSDGADIIAAMREYYVQNGVRQSWSQMMALPSFALDTKYYLPSYVNVPSVLDSQLRFANLGNNPTNVTVTIGGVPQGTYLLQPDEEKRVQYALNDGPVIIESDGEFIIAAMREYYVRNGVRQSWTQMLALPAWMLDKSYVLPSYVNVPSVLDSQLRFANLGTNPTDVTVTIGGVPQGTYTLQPDEEQRVQYSLNDGPVIIQSTGEPIIAAMREYYVRGGVRQSWSQMMALPSFALDDKYYLPSYVNVPSVLDSQLRFANLGNNPTNVTVTIGGVPQGTYLLQPDEEKRVQYALNDGPVIIESDGQKLIAAMREYYVRDGVRQSWSQMMALPDWALHHGYILPSYVNVSSVLDSQLRFGVP